MRNRFFKRASSFLMRHRKGVNSKGNGGGGLRAVEREEIIIIMFQ